MQQSGILILWGENLVKFASFKSGPEALAGTDRRKDEKKKITLLQER